MQTHPRYNGNYCEQAKDELKGLTKIFIDIVHEKQAEIDELHKRWTYGFMEWKRFDFISFKSDLDVKLSSAMPLIHKHDLQELIELADNCMIEYSRFLNFLTETNKDSQLVDEHSQNIKLLRTPDEYYRLGVEFAVNVKSYCTRNLDILNTLTANIELYKGAIDWKNKEYEEDKLKAASILENALSNASPEEKDALIKHILQYKYRDRVPISEVPSISINVDTQKQLIGLLGRLKEALNLDKHCRGHLAKIFAESHYCKSGKHFEFSLDTISKGI